jgi:hypothetical protein
MISRQTTLILCLLLSALALGVLWFLFEVRYMWYVKSDDFYFLRIGFFIGVVAIISLWTLYPSRLLVALIGACTFAFPPALRAGQFVMLDAKFGIFVIGALLLLVGATQLNRMTRKAAKS